MQISWWHVHRTADSGGQSSGRRRPETTLGDVAQAEGCCGWLGLTRIATYHINDVTELLPWNRDSYGLHQEQARSAG